jgi:Rnl2 family RNA ligase
MPTFVSFPDIENAYRTETINKIVQLGFSAGQWVVGEKVHGSSAQIKRLPDGQIILGKRSCFLAPGENFNGLNRVAESHKDKIESLYKHLGCQEMTLYGEICGGSYDHPNVAKVPGVTKVQKGVFYGPNNYFYGFDIVADGQWLDALTVEKLYAQFGFLHAKTLFCGSFEDAMKYPNEFDSKVPEQLGLPPISPNICEGVVLRPVKPLFFGCGSRVILKNKNDKWSEKSKESKHPRPPKEELKLSEGAIALLDSFSQFITENRLKNVISKIGDITGKDFGKLLGGLMQDAHKDFLKENPGFETLEKDEQKAIKSRIGEQAQTLIRKNFVNILDKNF